MIVDSLRRAAECSSGSPHSIEVKYIGQGDEDFGLVLDALKGDRKAEFLPLYGAINYLLFRVYEAAIALRGQAGLKMCIVVVDAQTWPAVELPLKNGWLDWTRPTFVPTEERDWNQFLEEQRDRRPAIDTELPNVVRSLDRIWIVSLNNRFEYAIAQEIKRG